MVRSVIEINNLSKLYRVGESKNLSIKESFERWCNKKLGKNSVAKQTKREEFPKEQQGPRQNTFWALKDISFTVNEGEAVGIIGSNGAGKSTLLKILSRITEPTSGRAIMRGRIASLLEVGTGFHPDLTGRENVYLNGAILGMRKREIDKKFDEIMAFAEIEKFIDTPVKHYSSGMYVRLAFAVAAHLDPEILMVDEILAVGDAMFQKKCLGKMGAVAKQGKTILFVSHNLGAIERLCSKSILLRNGQVDFYGPSNQAIKTYMTFPGENLSCFEQPADSNKAVRIRKVFLESTPGEAKTSFCFDEPLYLTVEYEVHKPVKNVSVWAGVFSLEGSPVFGTADTDFDEEKFKLRTIGRYQTTMLLSEKCLNAGNYSLVLGVSQYPERVAIERVEALNFTINDIGTPERIRTGTDRPGAIQPFIKWETKSQA